MFIILNIIIFFNYLSLLNFYLKGSHGKNFLHHVRILGHFNVTILLNKHFAASSGSSACIMLEITAIPSAPPSKTASTFLSLIPPSATIGI